MSVLARSEQLVRFDTELPLGGSASAGELSSRNSVLTIGPRIGLSVATVGEAKLFARRPLAHSVLLGEAVISHSGKRYAGRAFAVPAKTLHSSVESLGTSGAVAFLDARRYRFEDAERLAHAWRGFVPGRDDPREAFGDALKRPRRRLDARVEAMLELLEAQNVTVAQAARSARLSESRATHLLTEKLGAPPRAWRTWLRLRNAITEIILSGANLTQAAHRAGFADSAHFTRTSKRLLGVTPTYAVQPLIYVTPDT